MPNAWIIEAEKCKHRSLKWLWQLATPSHHFAQRFNGDRAVANDFINRFKIE